MHRGSMGLALRDIVSAMRHCSLVGMLGWQDIRQRYRRSTFGPFWLTINMGAMIATIGIVFGKIFDSPMQEFLPFLAAGMVLWGFISAVINEGCAGFISAEGIIKQLPIPLFVHILRMMWRNILMLGHNILILPLMVLIFGRSLEWVMLLWIPGFLLGVLNLTWVALVLGVLCARYRDLPQIVSSFLQVVFYLTPIVWMPKFLPQRENLYLLEYNPFYHLLEVMRSPLLGEVPPKLSWQVSLVMALLGWCLALAVYGRYKRRIAYWL